MLTTYDIVNKFSNLLRDANSSRHVRFARDRIGRHQGMAGVVQPGTIPTTAAEGAWPATEMELLERRCFPELLVLRAYDDLEKCSKGVALAL